MSKPQSPPDSRFISEAFRALPPPIIIIGMHRSGTSLVAGLLTIMGVYLDPLMLPPVAGQPFAAPGSQARQDGYCEATAFRLLNEAVMERTGSNWADPEPFLSAREQESTTRKSITLLRQATFGTLIHEYLEPGPKPLDGPWGWKDPRSSLTLPYWLNLFPDAKIVHVTRDPEAIVRSLMKRATETSAAAAVPPTLAARLGQAARYPALAVRGLARRAGLVARRPAYSLSDRAYCTRLTDIYITECSKYKDIVNHYMEVRYEDILSKPSFVAPELARFVGAKPTSNQMQIAVNFVERPAAGPPPQPPEASKGAPSNTGAG